MYKYSECCTNTSFEPLFAAVFALGHLHISACCQDVYIPLTKCTYSSSCCRSVRHPWPSASVCFVSSWVSNIMLSFVFVFWLFWFFLTLDATVAALDSRRWASYQMWSLMEATWCEMLAHSDIHSEGNRSLISLSQSGAAPGRTTTPSVIMSWTG